MEQVGSSGKGKWRGREGEAEAQFRLIVMVELKLRAPGKLACLRDGRDAQKGGQPQEALRNCGAVGRGTGLKTGHYTAGRALA
jgi:hypothetical protein